MEGNVLGTISLALAAYLVLPLPGLSAPLNKRIQQKRAQIAKVEKHKGVLTTTISRYNTRIEGLQGEIRSTQRRLSRVQSDLDDKRTELVRVRNRLETARDRLERRGASCAPRAGCWRRGWWRSTRATRRTR